MARTPRTHILPTMYIAWTLSALTYAHATPPADCNGVTYPTAVTYAYDPGDTNYVHTISGCKYDGGVTFTSSIGNGPLLGVQVWLTDSTASTINFTAAMNISTGSSVALRNVVATSAVTMGASFFGGSTGSIENSTLTGLLTINSAIQYGSDLMINATTITTTSVNACFLSSMSLQFHSSLRFLHTNITTTGVYAMYVNTSSISDGSRLVLEDSRLSGTNALYTNGYQLNSGGLLFMRRTTLIAATAGYRTLYIQGSGGRIDHDGSNRHTLGQISIMFNAPSSNNLFVLNQSTVDTVVYQQTSASHAVTNCTLAFLDSSLNTLMLTSPGPTTFFDVLSTVVPAGGHVT